MGLLPVLAFRTWQLFTRRSFLPTTITSLALGIDAWARNAVLWATFRSNSTCVYVRDILYSPEKTLYIYECSFISSCLTMIYVLLIVFIHMKGSHEGEGNSKNIMRRMFLNILMCFFFLEKEKDK